MHRDHAGIAACCSVSCRRSPCSPTKGRFQNENARKQRTVRHLEFYHSGYEPEGREFESPRAHHLNPKGTITYHFTDSGKAACIWFPANETLTKGSAASTFSENIRLSSSRTCE